MSNLPEGYGSKTTANSYYTHKNSLQLNCPFSTEARFFLAWVLHKIHILITLKCILIIYTDLTVSSMEKEILYKIIGSVGLILAVSDLWEDMRFNQSAVVFFFKLVKELFGNNLYFSTIVLLLILSVKKKTPVVRFCLLQSWSYLLTTSNLFLSILLWEFQAPWTWKQREVYSLTVTEIRFQLWLLVFQEIHSLKKISDFGLLRSQCIWVDQIFILFIYC